MLIQFASYLICLISMFSPDQQVLQVFAVKTPFPSICCEMLHPPLLGQDTHVYTD